MQENLDQIISHIEGVIKMQIETNEDVFLVGFQTIESEEYNPNHNPEDGLCSERHGNFSIEKINKTKNIKKVRKKIILKGKNSNAENLKHDMGNKKKTKNSDTETVTAEDRFGKLSQPSSRGLGMRGKTRLLFTSPGLHIKLSVLMSLHKQQVILLSFLFHKIV